MERQFTLEEVTESEQESWLVDFELLGDSGPGACILRSGRGTSTNANASADAGT